LEPPSSTAVAEHLDEVRSRIEARGRDPKEVKIVAVTKGFGPAAVAAALDAGLNDIGENYSDELLRKASAVSASGLQADGLCWHFLGTIQRRKVRDLAPVVDWWQTVSRLEEGEAIFRHGGRANVLVEVDATRLEGRNGCSPSEVPSLVEALRGLGLEVRGLMTIGPPGPPEESREAFRSTARIASEIGLPDLSMGMSGDFEVAIDEGATIVRIGRALFGERATRVR